MNYFLMSIVNIFAAAGLSFICTGSLYYTIHILVFFVLIQAALICSEMEETDKRVNSRINSLESRLQLHEASSCHVATLENGIAKGLRKKFRKE